MIWEVFRQQRAGRDFVYCRDVHAPDREMAKQYAVIQHGRRKPTHALWVAPQEEIRTVSADDTVPEPADEGEPTEWVVFSPDRRGYHTECGTVTAAGEDAAARRAVDTFGEDDELLWVVRETDIGEVTADDVTFGGTTDKSYRFAQTYNVDPAAEEVEASEEEQVEAERERRGDA